MITVSTSRQNQSITVSDKHCIPRLSQEPGITNAAKTCCEFREALEAPGASFVGTLTWLRRENQVYQQVDHNDLPRFGVTLGFQAFRKTKFPK